MDLKTLLERTNDAIDTIIRRDEHTETGEYLCPCIEGSIFTLLNSYIKLRHFFCLVSFLNQRSSNSRIKYQSLELLFIHIKYSSINK